MQVFQLFHPFLNIRFRLKLSGLGIFGAVVLQEFDDVVVALRDDFFDLFPVIDQDTLHLVIGFGPPVHHLELRVLARLAVGFIVGLQPLDDLRLAQHHDIPHLFDQLLRMLEQVLVVVGYVLGVILEARDLLVDGILLGFDLVLRQIPRHLLPERVDLGLDALRFLLPRRVSKNALILDLEFTELRRLILGIRLLLAKLELLAQQVFLLLERVDPHLVCFENFVPLNLVPPLDQIEDGVLHLDLGVQHILFLLLPVLNGFQNQVPKVDLHCPDLLALFIHGLGQRLDRGLVVDQLFGIVLMRLLELVQIVGYIFVVRVGGAEL